MVQEVSGEGRVASQPGQIGLRPEPVNSLGHSATVPSRMAFIIAASAIERDVRISELTDAEIDSIISAVSACSTDALSDCFGALQFILAFYESGQRYLDTDAWKQACASGVVAYHKAAKALGKDAIPYEAWNGEVQRRPSLTRQMMAAQASEAAERGEPYNERNGG